MRETSNDSGVLENLSPDRTLIADVTQEGGEAASIDQTVNVIA